MQVKFIPAQDLRVIDALWRAASGSKFGYSVQKEVWVQNRRYWERLFKAIDWVQGEYNMYRWEGPCKCSRTYEHHITSLQLSGTRALRDSSWIKSRRSVKGPIVKALTG